MPRRATEYLIDTGIVAEACFPYAAQSGRAPACRSTCTDGTAFKRYKCKAGSLVHPKTVGDIKAELFEHGPLLGAFAVTQEFFRYQSGVFSRVSNNLVGGHAIKVLGWGTEANIPYWLCANSWGIKFGE